MEKPRTLKEARMRASLALQELSLIGGEDVRKELQVLSKLLGTRLIKKEHEYLDSYQPPRRNGSPLP